MTTASMDLSSSTRRMSENSAGALPCDSVTIFVTGPPMLLSTSHTTGIRTSGSAPNHCAIVAAPMDANQRDGNFVARHKISLERYPSAELYRSGRGCCKPSERARADVRVESRQIRMVKGVEEICP